MSFFSTDPIFGMLILQYTNMIYCFIVKMPAKRGIVQYYSCKNGKFVNFHFKRDFLHFDILRIFSRRTQYLKNGSTDFPDFFTQVYLSYNLVDVPRNFSYLWIFFLEFFFRGPRRRKLRLSRFSQYFSDNIKIKIV